jgi:hypothetical protein
MISPTDLFHPSPAPNLKTFQVFLIYCPKCPSVKRTEKLQNGKLLNINEGTVYKEKLTVIIKQILEI